MVDKLERLLDKLAGAEQWHFIIFSTSAFLELEKEICSMLSNNQLRSVTVNVHIESKSVSFDKAYIPN